MAEKPKNPTVSTNQQNKNSFGLILKIMAVVVALVMLVGLGFAAGVYLKLIDPNKLVSDMNLSQHPVITKLFPKTNFEPVELEDSSIPDKPENTVKNVTELPSQTSTTQSTRQLTNSNTITKEEIEKQERIKKQEEAKRISKLARLYSEMKPDEAAAIMKELDDNNVLAIFSKMEDGQVAKILAVFDSKRAARLTEDMLKGPAKPAI